MPPTLSLPSREEDGFTSSMVTSGGITGIWPEIHFFNHVYVGLA